MATIDGDWGTTVCGNCYADLHPDITVTVQYYSVRSPGRSEPLAVIRERTRSDHRFPDLGEQLGWSLAWEHTTVLAEEHRDGSSYHVTTINRDDAEQIATSLALKYWTPEATQLPWVTHAYPQ